MKKVFFSLLMFVFCISFVQAHNEVVTKKYVIELDEKKYVVHADYAIEEESDGMIYTLSNAGTEGSIRLYNEVGEEVTDKINFFDILSFESLQRKTGFDLPRFYDIEEDIFLDENRMNDFLPKFTVINGKIYAYTYTDDEEFLEQFNSYNSNGGNWEKLDWNEVLKDMKKYGYIRDTNVSLSLGSILESLEDFQHGDEEYIGTEGFTKDAFIAKALEINELLNKAYDIDICTQDDLEAIRTQRDVPFVSLQEEFSAPLSTSCYNLLFGKGNLYKKTLSIAGDITTYSAKDSDYNYTMSFLFLETAYLRSHSFLTGNAMQVEPVEVLECGFFGKGTVKFLQELFDVLKFAGIIIGTLLAIVDIFKAVVGKEDAMKKSLKTMMKRIAAIVALILTPFIIEIIFEIVNTIGITNPICGIR